MAKYLKYEVVITLLEDLHSGTGMGDAGGAIDSVQIRDRKGNAVLRETHVKGVMRDNLAMLNQMGADFKIVKLFGNKGDDSYGSLSMTSFNAVGRRFKIWSSSSREEGSRMTKDDTLRSEEFVASGLKFKGFALVDEELKADFEAALRTTASLGSNRTRGGGRVKIEYTQMAEDITSTNSLTAKPVLRILLKNPEPLCLPPTRYQGNDISTETFIRGHRLRAAFAQWFSDRSSDKSVAPPILNEKVVTTDALYCSDEAFACELSKIDVIPIPLCIHTSKPAANGIAIPWWADDNAPGKKYIDKLEKKTQEKEEKTKRPKGNEVLFRKDSSGPWNVCQPKIFVHLRNQINSKMPYQSGKKKELYSMEEIADNQFFLADIYFKSAAEAEKFISSHAALFNKTSWLRIGRGGKPVHIERYEFIDNPMAKFKNGDKFILTSDVIIRNEYLNFVTEINNDTLNTKFELKNAKIREKGNDQPSPNITEPCEIRSWNGVSGTQRSPAIALKRGSAISLKEAATIDNIYTAGERQVEGFGRFVLLNEINLVDAGNKPISANENQAETCLSLAEGIKKRLGSVNDSSKKTQWEWVHGMLRNGEKWNDTNGICNKIEEHSEKKAGKYWEGIIEKLKKEMREIPEGLKEKTLEYTVRYILVEMKKGGAK